MSALPLVVASLIEFVNPFHGTAAKGHCYPGAVRPFGLIQESPDTVASDGQQLRGFILTYAQIMAGGGLVFEMCGRDGRGAFCCRDSADAQSARGRGQGRHADAQLRRVEAADHGAWRGRFGAAPELDFAFAARAFLFGYNCDPFQE